MATGARELGLPGAPGGQVGAGSSCDRGIKGGARESFLEGVAFAGTQGVKGANPRRCERCRDLSVSRAQRSQQEGPRESHFPSSSSPFTLRSLEAETVSAGLRVGWWCSLSDLVAPGPEGPVPSCRSAPVGAGRALGSVPVSRRKGALEVLAESGARMSPRACWCPL